MRKSLAWNCFIKANNLSNDLSLQKAQFTVMTKFRAWHHRMITEFCKEQGYTYDEVKSAKVEKIYLSWLEKKFEVKE